ncbi:hypothetical protein HPULCUR_002721 [Helicostylum pulchrum]|uniref:Uncharacterized protein n=1 Tax=Helicostylum pulchrum TaxID=562976 RepID=A0ABP9XRD4_9FUNG
MADKYTNIKGTTGCGHRLIMVAYMMAAKFMHVNLRSIIDTSSTTTAPSSPAASLPNNNNNNLARTSAERSTIHTNKYTLPPIISKSNEQLPSPPTSPKAYSDSDPLNYHYFQSPRKNSINNNNTPLQPLVQNERHFQILRMELEFLHFLNYDLSLTDTLKWIHWAQSFQEDDTCLSSDTSDTDEFHYTSADEGDDELDAEGH